ncbi:hypothetical protein WJX72_007442 [[Myrmecia] bisecta]|uniref:Protein kinase domain-containing protein n=1 Tax=[Myrmecia] bisecta TaxID=41462 RepID=A0AAW1Q177_9CHLO
MPPVQLTFPLQRFRKKAWSLRWSDLIGYELVQRPTSAPVQITEQATGKPVVFRDLWDVPGEGDATVTPAIALSKAWGFLWAGKPIVFEDLCDVPQEFIARPKDGQPTSDSWLVWEGLDLNLTHRIGAGTCGSTYAGNIAGKLVAVKMAEIENHKAGDLSTAPRELLGTQSESVLAVMEQLRKFKVPRGT